MKLGQKIVMEHSGNETETERRLRAVYKKSFRKGRGALAYAFDLCFALLTAAFALYICIRPHFESRAAARLVTGICLALLAVIWKAAENELFIRHIKRLRERKKQQISKARLTVRMYERFLSREEGPGVYVSRSVESLSADEVITALKTRSLPVTVISCAEPTEKAAELINALGNEVRFKKFTPPESAWQCEEVTESDTDAPSTRASAEPAASEEPTETESVTVAPVTSSGYKTGHYVNSTESRVHIRNTTSKSGKHVDYVQPEEYIDVFEVLDLGASTDATVRWWGKVTKSGKTGWVSLYYLTCVDLIGTPLNAGQIDQLWQTLQGYWNTLDKKRYSSFSTDNGSPYFVYSPWSGSAVISAYVDAEGIGDLNGLVRLHLNGDAAGASGGVNEELYLDLSEMKNGRLAWSFGTGWEDGYFAGTDQSKAKPKS